ncbi:hypothetical protein Emag_004413 [Eimeria magna]
MAKTRKAAATAAPAAASSHSSNICHVQRQQQPSFNRDNSSNSLGAAENTAAAAAGNTAAATAANTAAAAALTASLLSNHSLEQIVRPREMSQYDAPSRPSYSL